MKFPLLFTFCTALLAAVPLSATDGWTGKLVYKVKTSDYTTELRVFTDGSSWRYEMGNPADPHTVWLALPGKGETYEISHFKQTYSAVPDPRSEAGRRPPPSESDRSRREITIKPIGERTIEGRLCRGYEIKSEEPDTEVWMTDLPTGFPRPLFLIFHKLREVIPGLDTVDPAQLGLPVLVSQKSWIGRTLFGLELVELVSEPVPASLFEFPEGYRKIGADVRPEKRGWR